MNKVHSKPPQWAIRFLEWFCPDDLSEQILGDLHEQFYEDCHSHSFSKAKSRYVWNTIKFFKPSILFKNKLPVSFTTIHMITNYIQIALRRLRNDVLISTINILGLSIGLASCLIIALFVSHELDYDKHIPEAENVVRVTREWIDQDGETSLHLARVAAPIGPLLKEDFGEIELMGRMNEYSFPIKLGDQYIEEEFYFTEPSILDILGVQLEAGNSSSALNDPHSIIISHEVAEKYFPQINPLGEFLVNASGTEFLVTGVMKPSTEPTHLPLNILASWSTLHEYFDDSFFQNWGGNNFFTYLKLKSTEDKGHLPEKLTDFMKRHDSYYDRSVSYLHLQNVTDIHLHSHLDAEAEANGNITTVYILISIGLVILTLACFNFISLSTSKALDRSREVGVRKVFGARRYQLIIQFIVEAIIVTLLSLLLAIITTKAILPEINQLINRNLSLLSVPPLQLFLLLGGGLLITGLFAGMYPAHLISSFAPATVLRGRGKFLKGNSFQRIIVVVQFTVSVALIMWVKGMHEQMNFVYQKDLGFNKEQIAIFPLNNEIKSSYSSIKTQLENEPDIESVTISKFVPSSTLVDNVIISMETKGVTNEYTITNIQIGHDYFKTYGINLLSGRDFISGSGLDSSSSVVVNREFARTVGMENVEELIGKSLIWSPGDESEPMRIVGVVEDFHYESLHNEIPPLIFKLDPRYFSRISVKMKSDSPIKTAELVTDVLQPHMGNNPVWFEFVDQNLQALYEEEQTNLTLIFYFSLMAVLIACAGLLGMVVHHAERKRKEIAIRKVLGATEFNVTWYILRKFLLLVMAALVVGLPLGYMVTTQWLNNFIEHITLTFPFFIYTSVLIIGFTVITTLYHAVKASLINPVNNLRNE